jgi:hypothetical protein
MRRKLDQINQKFPACAGSSTLLPVFDLVALAFCHAARAASTQYCGGLPWDCRRHSLVLERSRPKRPI